MRRIETATAARVGDAGIPAAGSLTGSTSPLPPLPRIGGGGAATAVWLALDFDRGTWAPALDRDRDFTFPFDRDCADRALAGDW